MRKVYKLILIILFFMVCISVCNIVSAADVDNNKGKFSGFQTEINKVDKWGTNSGVSSTKKIMGTIIQVIRIVGTGMAIIMLTYVAIKYMSVAPEDKADFKKSATAYIVGAIVLFAAVNIVQIISNFAINNT